MIRYRKKSPILERERKLIGRVSWTIQDGKPNRENIGGSRCTFIDKINKHLIIEDQQIDQLRRKKQDLQQENFLATCKSVFMIQSPYVQRIKKRKQHNLHKSSLNFRC
jgi:hypothetical protein